MIPFGTTLHCILRPFRASDRALNLQLFNDPRVSHSTVRGYVLPQGETSGDRFASVLERALLALVLEIKPEFLGMRGEDPLEIVDEQESEAEEREREKFVGLFTLLPGEEGAKNGDATLGIGLMYAWWGKGLAREVMEWLMRHVFEKMGMRRLTLNVFGDNERAVGLYRRLGFVQEGRKREALWRDGKWVDHVRMGMLEREWRARHGEIHAPPDPEHGLDQEPDK